MSEQGLPDVGAQLRRLRKQRRLSMRALAEMCELSPNTVSLIERGATSPNVSTLHQLASALRVPITAFFQGQGEQVQVIHSRPGQRPSTSDPGVLLESLGSDLEDQTLEPFVVTMRPEADSGMDPIVHPGHELVFCLQGELEYRIEERIYRLPPGESLLFEAELPHCWRNPSKAESTVFLLIFQSAQTGEPLEQHLHH